MPAPDESETPRVQCPCDGDSFFTMYLQNASRNNWMVSPVVVSALNRPTVNRHVYSRILHAISNRVSWKRFELVNDARHCIGSSHSATTCSSIATSLPFLAFCSIRIFAQSAKFLVFYFPPAISFTILVLRMRDMRACVPNEWMRNIKRLRTLFILRTIKLLANFASDGIEYTVHTLHCIGPVETASFGIISTFRLDLGIASELNKTPIK